MLVPTNKKSLFDFYYTGSPTLEKQTTLDVVATRAALRDKGWLGPQSYPKLALYCKCSYHGDDAILRAPVALYWPSFLTIRTVVSSFRLTNLYLFDLKYHGSRRFSYHLIPRTAAIFLVYASIHNYSHCTSANISLFT